MKLSKALPGIILQKRDSMSETVERPWGKYTFLDKREDVVVKELVIQPGKSISYQRHHKRSESWFISEGQCIVKYTLRGPDSTLRRLLTKFDRFEVPCGMWHQLINTGTEPCHIVEIQYGEEPNELDIERIEE